MITFALNIRPLARAAREPAAWFIPEADVQGWMEEVAAWGIPTEGLKLFAASRSASTREPGGLLVVTGKLARPRVRLALPYGVVAEKLYLPVDAGLSPDVSETELRQSLRWDVQVIHPAYGLCGFARSDAMSVSDLFNRPARRSDSHWDSASPGIRIAPRLVAVEMELPESSQEILDEARDDIGAQADEEPPEMPEESKLEDFFTPMANAVFGPISRWLERLKKIKKPPAVRRGGGKASSASSGSGWSQRLQSRLESLRFRELERLCRMLRDDPDLGLQYAIPLRSLPGRGRARAGWRLLRRSPIFDLGLFRRAPAVDSWNAPDRFRRQLLEQYRHAANRELALGRYRRAAYIFAHLLGDFAAAADALKRGRHFREAAVLYRERLNDARSAAQCLADGGLLIEAMEAFEELGDYIMAGDLAARIERGEDAARLYRLAVAEALKQSDPRRAAEILETKLKAPDEAIELLERQWPDSPVAGLCLTAWFDLAARLSYHDRASARLAKFGAEIIRSPKRVAFVQAMSSIATTYPHVGVRAAASDLTLQVAGDALPGDDVRDRAALVHAVQSLARHDRLLERDGQRFLSRRDKPPPALPRSSTVTPVLPYPLKQLKVRLLHTLRLPQGYQWQSLHAGEAENYAVGKRDGAMGIARFIEGRWQMEEISLNSAREISLAVLARQRARELWLVGLRGKFALASSRRFQPNSGFPQETVFLTPDRIFGDRLSGICLDEHDHAWCLDGIDGNYVTLACWDSGGSILSTYSLTLTPGRFSPLVPPLPMAAHRGVACIGMDNQLTVVERGGRHRRIELPHAIRHIVPAGPITRTRFLVLLEQGAALCTPDASIRDECALFGNSIDEPAGAFLRNGSIVLAGRDGGTVYESSRRLVPVSSFSFKGAATATIAIGSDRFAVLTEDGAIMEFQAPSA